VNPRFTVLMPTNYRPDVIGYAIQSVLNQTEPDFELFVVGDGAPPETAAAVGRFTDPRIRWFDLPKGPRFGYANRNIALREARGDLVAYAADDDLMFPDHLELHGAALRNPGIQWSYSQALWVSSDGIAGPDLTNLHSADEREYFTTVGNTICGGSVVFRADAFPTRACFPEDAPSMADWVMFNHLLDAYRPAALAIIRQPTLLHFTAGRKRERHSGFELLQGYLAVADRVSWWPEPLRPTIPDGVSPQAVFAERLSESGGVAAMRNAALAMINRIALDNLAPRASTSARSALAFEKLERQNALLKAQLSALQSSTSWRFTAPLRVLGAALARLRPKRHSRD
jgi:glycosyltransferase involved in cell wall biosynthesis